MNVKITNSLVNNVLTRLFILIIALVVGCSKSKFPKEYLDDRQSFTRSITVLRKASDLSQPPSGQSSFEMSKDQEEQYFKLLEEGIKLSDKVSDRFLDFLHSDLRHMYRKNLIVGTKLYYEGVKNNNLAKQIQGNERMNKWISFWENNYKIIIDTAYP